jgi:hypothetical protein
MPTRSVSAACGRCAAAGPGARAPARVRSGPITMRMARKKKAKASEMTVTSAKTVPNWRSGSSCAHSSGITAPSVVMAADAIDWPRAKMAARDLW